MDKSELCLVPFTWHVSAVPGIKIKLLDRKLKMLLVQGHTVIFDQNFLFIRKEDNFLYLKSARSHYMLWWSFVILIRKHALVFVCLFICLVFFVPIENCSLIRRRHHYRWRAQILTFARHSWQLSSEGF